MDHSASTAGSSPMYPSILREEYRTLVEDVGRCASDDAIIRAIVMQADWTERGGTEVLRLAREYGTSIFRNALARAESLNIEDGSRGL